MEINKEVTVKITTKELEKIIVKHLYSKGVSVNSVYFDIWGYCREDDFFGRYPSEHRLREVVCKGIENKCDKDVKYIRADKVSVWG